LVYLFLCVLGAVLPYSQFFPWIIENGFSVDLFFRQLFANRISGFFGMDVFVSAVVLVVFVLGEGKRLGMRLLWLPIAGLFVVGVSLGLPMFLYLRERAMEERGATMGPATAS